MKIVSALLIAVLALSCGEDKTQELTNAKSEGGSGDRQDLRVEGFLITDNPFYSEIQANGKIVAKEKVDLVFQNAGILTRCDVKNGQQVRKGQLLFQQDQRELNNQLEGVKIKLLSAKQELEKEKINFKYSASKKNADSLLTSLKIKTNVYAIENELESIQLRLQKTTITAPFDGFIANLKIQKGQNVTALDPICTVLKTNAVDVVFSILASDYMKINLNDLVSVSYFHDPGKNYSGVISEKNPSLGENNLFQIKATISNSNNDLIDGMNVKISVKKKVESALKVPKSGVLIKNGKNVVFSVKNNVTMWNYCTIIGENEEYYGITGEISTGDTIITQGHKYVTHNSPVKITYLHSEN
jgi:RND family efflux transporter MFP subunit